MSELIICITRSYDDVKVSVDDVPVLKKESGTYKLDIVCDGSSCVKVSAKGYKDYVFYPTEPDIIIVELEPDGLSIGQKVLVCLVGLVCFSCFMYGIGELLECLGSDSQSCDLSDWDLPDFGKDDGDCNI